MKQAGWSVRPQRFTESDSDRHLHNIIVFSLSEPPTRRATIQGRHIVIENHEPFKKLTSTYYVLKEFLDNAFKFYDELFINIEYLVLGRLQDLLS